MADTQTYTITTGRSMSNSGYHRCGGSSSGSAHWWLKSKATGEFIDLPRRVRGDSDGWTMDVDLEPGDYTLGTGKGRDAYRATWTATGDGQWV